MNRLRLSGARARWSPYSIAPSVRCLWLSASDHGSALMTDDGAGLISSWSGRNSPIQTFTAATTARGAFSATGMGGLYPAVSGDGTAINMTMASTTGLPTSTSPSVMISLANYTGNAVSGARLFESGTASANALRRFSISSTGSIQASNGTATVVAAPALGQTASRFWSSPAIVVGSWATDLTETVRVDGGAYAGTTTMAALSTGTTRSRIFASVATSAANFWTGPLSEHIILAGSIATLLPTIQMIEGWLAWTAYPLLNLATAFPASHPYKGGPP